MSMTLDDLRNADTFDSHDVIGRIAELEEELWDATDATSCLGPEDYAELADELDELRYFAASAEDSVSDWPYGETFIRDSYFWDYAQELAEDLGAIPSEYTWPISCIDWGQAARELQVDYSTIELAGVTFWVRS